MEYILWATKKGNPEYMEQLITETTSLEHLSEAKSWAIQNGYEKLRVMEYNGEAPDFTQTIAI
jgi:hypothetical protein